VLAVKLRRKRDAGQEQLDVARQLLLTYLLAVGNGKAVAQHELGTLYHHKSFRVDLKPVHYSHAIQCAIEEGLCVKSAGADQPIAITGKGKSLVRKPLTRLSSKLLFQLYRLGGGEKTEFCLPGGISEILKVHEGLVRAVYHNYREIGFVERHSDEHRYRITQVGIAEIGRLRRPYYFIRVLAQRHGLAIVSIIIAVLSLCVSAASAALSIYRAIGHR